MNIRNMSAIVLPAALALAAVVSGCGPSSGKTSGADSQNEPAGAPLSEENAGPTVEDRLNELFMKADTLFSGGSTNEALASLEGALADPELAGEKQQVFNMLIRMMTFAGRIGDARERMLDAYANHHELAIGAKGLVYAYYVENFGDFKAAAEWTEKVMAIPTLQPEIRRDMREWNFMSHIQLGDADKIAAIADGLVRDAPAGDAVVILQRGIDMLFDRKRADVVDRILAQAGKIVTSDAATRNLITASRLRLMASQGNWDALEKALPGAASDLPDSDLQRVLRRVLSAASAAKPASPTVDTLCLIIINGFTNKTQAASIAARQWTDNAAKNAPGELPDRLEVLVNKQFPAQLLCGIFLRNFYDVIDNSADVKEMKSIGERLIPLAQDDDVRNSIRTMVLDSCFLIEDFDGALRILNQGIGGYDKTWHNMAIAKVEAHKALKENRPGDAIKSFRAFMSIIEISKDNETADPSTGVVHSKAMILGRNAKRIGDIYKQQLNNEAEAKAAYAEARKYYQDALDAKPDPEALEVIKAEMAEIPQ